MKIHATLLLSAIAGWTSGYSQSITHHELNADVNIEAKSISVTDNITIPADYFTKHDTLSFYLNGNLQVKSLNPAYKLSEITLKEEALDSTAVVSKRYILKAAKPSKLEQTISLQYSGKVSQEIKMGAVEYARGFSETSGIISDKGVYLANATQWIPDFDTQLFTFNLTTTIGTDWGVVSQGTRTKNEITKGKRVIRYESSNPADEVYLIAAKWTEYNKKDGDIAIQAFLRTPDSAMATKYLDATIKYMGMYVKLVGTYPYTKFALVENFWETGYGMPSFTLLGEQIIRFPFIINTSYPHELLHNWWGNSVYVDATKGNWCEGLTAYMADHLMKEQMGQGPEYRRDMLQKFTNYVNETNDFPVVKFVSRHNSAEEAIGYGKVAMINHMLRMQLGDETFTKAYSKFYQDNKFKETSFNEIEKSFEAVSGKNLKAYFDQWLLRKGAPTLTLSNVEAKAKDAQYELSFKVSQVQKEDAFDITMPVAIYLEGAEAVEMRTIQSTEREKTYSFVFDKRPIRVDVDPQFDVFRRLDRNEIAPTISQVLGSKESMMILPKASPYLKEYTELANAWKESQKVQGNNMAIVFDNEVKELPTDKAVWIIGFDNEFTKKLSVLASYNNAFPKETNDLIEKATKEGSLVYAFRNPANDTYAAGFIGSNNPKAVAGLNRKLPHYSRYGYLAFEGDEPTNTLKGEFPALNSPLSAYIKYNGETLKTAAKLKPRKALVY
ncbi:MAG: hypothetical protein HY840_12285 [Bacteroidetes bacterium]|nr:hypothetical protein [Bacteroidota bacterium]